MTTLTQVADLYSWKEVAQQASELIDSGQLVALPTETVYGLAGSAFDAEAVAKIFEVKERPSFDPLIVHIGSIDDLQRVVVMEPELEQLVHKIAARFWPGPLTLVLPKHPDIPDLVTSGLNTVAVRISDHEIMREVCKLAGPLAAPSANRFGRISPTSASAVQKELDGKIPLIVDAGACREGIESTIIKPVVAEVGKKPIFTVLRPGALTREVLRTMGKVEKVKPGIRASPAVASGMMDSHYAPRTPLYLYSSAEEFTPKDGKSYGLLSLKGDPSDEFHQKCEWDAVVALSPGSGKLTEAAVRLFWALRELDESGVDEIIAESVSIANIGTAILDRLKKASVNH